jgi:protease I
LVAVAFTFSCTGGGDASSPLKGKKIAMIVADRWFRDEELLEPKEIFEENGAKVLVVSSARRKAKGSLRAQGKPDLVIGELKVDDFDAIIFVGGKGASEYWDDSTAHAIARNAVEKDKILGAICTAPVTLARAGVLDRKNATVWRTERDKIEEKGAVPSDERVTVDGNIVTAYGPGDAEEFAQTIVEKLKEKAVSSH